ncbi:ABC transporter ATP-binding protein, partial [Sutterella sp.]|uniref:ABC transporter ATP-binding protein n=1 Tax=Sutterella sp. TaxID=1981025 RepID=UPI0026DEC841
MTQTEMKAAVPVLEVKGLTVEITARGKTLRALDGVDFSIAGGEILGMVGESGAGKSMTGQALIGLLPPGAAVTAGEISLEGQRIDTMPEAERERLRGSRIGAIFQDPLTSLDPLMKVGDQLVETILAHRPDMTKESARARAVALLKETGIPSPEARARQYPHEFSGGMRQRVVIALALAAEPKLIIADEPTTALDVSIQAQIIGLLKRLAREHGAAILLITHDMGVIAETADRVAVLYSGEIVEIGEVADVISRPQHPYTKGLMGAIPDISAPGLWLEQIEGSMPGLADRPAGCPFHPRCRAAMERCRTERPPLAPMGTSWAACWLASPTGRAVPDSLVRFHPKRLAQMGAAKAA